MFKETFAITSGNRENSSTMSNLYFQIKRNQFIEFIGFENRYRISKY